MSESVYVVPLMTIERGPFAISPALRLMCAARAVSFADGMLKRTTDAVLLREAACAGSDSSITSSSESVVLATTPMLRITDSLWMRGCSVAASESDAWSIDVLGTRQIDECVCLAASESESDEPTQRANKSARLRACGRVLLLLSCVRIGAWSSAVGVLWPLECWSLQHERWLFEWTVVAFPIHKSSQVMARCLLEMNTRELVTCWLKRSVSNASCVSYSFSQAVHCISEAAEVTNTRIYVK